MRALERQYKTAGKTGTGGASAAGREEWPGAAGGGYPFGAGKGALPSRHPLSPDRVQSKAREKTVTDGSGDAAKRRFPVRSRQDEGGNGDKLGAGGAGMAAEHMERGHASVRKSGRRDAWGAVPAKNACDLLTGVGHPRIRKDRQGPRATGRSRRTGSHTAGWPGPELLPGAWRFRGSCRWPAGAGRPAPGPAGRSPDGSRRP